MLYVLPFIDSDVNSSVRTELPAKRPALFTSATRPTTSAPDGTTVSPSSTIGSLSEPWKESPTWFFSESSGFSSLMTNCVPAGTVTFFGGAGGGGGVCSAGAEGGVSSATRASAPAFSAPLSLALRRLARSDSDIYSLLDPAADGLGVIRRAGCDGGDTLACCT